MNEKIRVVWLKDRGARVEKTTRGFTWMRTIGPRGEITVAESAALLGVTTVTVLRWLASGELVVWGKQRQATVRLDQLRKVAENRGLFIGVGE